MVLLPFEAPTPLAAMIVDEGVVAKCNPKLAERKQSLPKVHSDVVSTRLLVPHGAQLVLEVDNEQRWEQSKSATEGWEDIQLEQR